MGSFGVVRLDDFGDIDEVRGLGSDSKLGGGSKSTDLHGGSPAIAEGRHAAQFDLDGEGDRIKSGDTE
jgi:hypothetical protein